MSRRRPKNVREAARRQRKDQCRICRRQEDLTTHHVDGDWENNDPANLVTTCATCHEALNRAEQKGWKVRLA